MFDIHHRRSHNSGKDRVVIKTKLPTIEAARNARVVSGDLVVYSGTNEVVRNRCWLWAWELKDPRCYAQRAIES